MTKKLFVCFLFLSFSLSGISQQSSIYNHALVDYDRAVGLYKNGLYEAAQRLFIKVRDNSTDEGVKSDAAYYIANSAVRLNQPDADVMMEDFVKKYPTSVRRNSAQLEVANYYFEQGKYSQAEKWYQKINPNILGMDEQEKYYFNSGYIHFKAGRKEQAQKDFNRVIRSEKYGSQAKYYIGYMAYEGDDYEKATEIFEEMQDEGKYGKEVSYYQADMNFKQGNFEKAIETGKAQYSKSSPQEKNQLSKIIGESYFNLGQYEEAIPYLKEYKGVQGKWNNTDYYQLGYAYFRQGDYQKAIGEFNKIIDGKNAVAQNAYYHLAESYLHLNQKQQALNAFKHASEMNFNDEIQEDSFLNYAKLSYEIGNSYKNTTQVILEFLEKYPKNPQHEFMQELLIDSYITSRNFKEALSLLETNKNFRNKEAYQKVAFYRGLELYTESNYKEALTAFDKSLSEPHDPTILSRATYWKAETDFQLSNFESALSGFKKFEKMSGAQKTEEFKNIKYNLGYAQFKLKQYPAAIESFSAFVKSSSITPEKKKDAFLRLGDSYFVTSQYWPAMENYNAAIEIVGKEDYAHYQKAISYGFVDRVERKIEDLKVFIRNYRNSVYRDDAMYELGNTYISQKRPQDAIAIYDQLMTEIPNSTFVPQALMKKALLYDNAGNSKDALATFKKVAKDYPNSPEAIQAVAAAKNIYIEEGKVDEYAAWVKTLNFVEIGDSELDDSSYLAAEQPYMENNFSEAKKRFESYLKKYPQGRNAIKAHFYLGQMLFADNQKDKSIPHYRFVVEKETNTYTEQALARLSESYLAQNEYQHALTYLQRLETEADFPQNLIFAQTNIMKATYELKNYDQTVKYAEKVLANTQIDNTIRSDAQLFIARSALKTGNEAKAKTAYAEVQKIATGNIAAEALYYDAYFKNKEGKYQASNETIQKLAKDYSAHKRFGAKGLVLMAKNFYALKDAYQATYILESVISNFEEYPEIIEEAKSELAAIKREEAKTNASIQTN